MQPYFLPYIGYWQLLSAVDRFIVYDNVQYTKKGWINRNRFLRQGGDALFTVPLKKGSDFLTIVERSIADDFDSSDLVNGLTSAYRRAPFFGDAFPLIESIVTSAPRNLFEYLFNSIRMMSEWLGIGTPMIVSSTVAIDHALKGESKVLALCRSLEATHYVNAIGGRTMYSGESFSGQGIELKFIQTRPIVYRQFDHPFVANLSIVDVLMFNSRDAVREMLGAYDLVS